jgi:hypothetical protein
MANAATRKTSSIAKLDNASAACCSALALVIAGKQQTSARHKPHARGTTTTKRMYTATKKPDSLRTRCATPTPMDAMEKVLLDLVTTPLELSVSCFPSKFPMSLQK